MDFRFVIIGEIFLFLFIIIVEKLDFGSWICWLCIVLVEVVDVVNVFIVFDIIDVVEIILID